MAEAGNREIITAGSWGVMALLFTISYSAVAEKHHSFNGKSAFPNEVYWGDTHLHTSLSVDAYGGGNRAESDVAYRFARGEPVTFQNGRSVQIRRPLDFLVVADHAENMAVSQAMARGDIRLLDQSLLKAWSESIRPGKKIDWGNADKSSEQVARLFRQRGWGNKKIVQEKGAASASFSDEYLKGAWGQEIGSKAFRQSVWEQVTAVADQFNEPGKFTALIGYEWSPLFPTPNVGIKGSSYSGMEHRVVIFKDAAQKVNQITLSPGLTVRIRKTYGIFLSTTQRKPAGKYWLFPITPI